ncbi:MAG: hypothetical protein JWP12_2685 [Bacteroidetes bacterium]|nr:hypothetical protein [Bacteroidota bacterium]
MFKRILFWFFILLCISGGVYWFVYTKESRMPVGDGINAIPANAALIFESKQAKNTWKKLSQTNIMWEELLGTETFAKLNLQARYVDSVIELDPFVAPLPDDHSVFISVHPATANTFEFLFVYSLPNLTYQSGLQTFLEKLNNGRAPVAVNYEDEQIQTISPAGKNPLSLSFVNGTLIMSMQHTLVEDAIRQLKSNTSLAKDRSFSKVLTTAGKKVDANVYVNYKMFPQILSSFVFPTFKNDVNELAHFADCSGWDIALKPNSVMLSGFTYSNDSLKSNFLNIFNKQKAQTIELTKVIPAKTALMVFYGISNTKTFHEDYLTYLKAKDRLQNYNRFRDTVNAKYGIDVEPAMLHWIDNEMALVVTEPAAANYSDNAFAVMHSGNIEDALGTLNGLSDNVNKTNEEKTDTSNFRGHTIGRLNIPDVLPQLFGWQFNKIRKCYYTSIADYIVFGNSSEALQNFITAYENNKTLANDKNYSAFAENISTESNVYIYSAIASSTAFYSNFVTEPLVKDMEKKSDLIHKFEAAGIQFTFNNKLFYSNIYLKYNPVYKQETGTLWETKLDTTVSSKPYLVINHNTKAKEVLVQDDANKIYLISNTGKIIWTKQLDEKIMSDVIQLDVLKNNKLQMLFNTSTTIYMYDRNGNDMKGFPIKLKSPATNQLSVVDYENNRDYRIFIACENKKILCYKANGELVDGFQFDKTANPVYLPVQYFSASNKDHLCAIDVKGKIYILDRKGETRIRLKEQMAQGIRNFYIESGKDYSKSYIVASDTLGNVIKISLTGDKEKMKFQDFETSPYFEYKDINNDKTCEYIFLSRTELKVFNADKSLLFRYEFKDKITQLPQYFLFPDGTGKLGIVSDAANELYLFNDNGSLYDSFPLKGKTAFSIGDLNNEGIYNLVTGSADNSIYVYQLQ